MATPTPGTIPALTPYQPGALPLGGDEQVEITSTSNATSAASYRLTLVEAVGKAAGALPLVTPSSDDLVAILDHNTGLPASARVGDISGVAPNFPAEPANVVFAGPASGVPHTPGFRSLVVADLIAPTLRVATSTASVNFLVTDIELGIDTRTVSATVFLPTVASWYASNPIGLDLCIVDIFGNAGTRNITPQLGPGDTFLYGGVTPVINANFGNLRLRPVLGTALGTTTNSWYVRGIN